MRKKKISEIFNRPQVMLDFRGRYCYSVTFG